MRRRGLGSSRFLFARQKARPAQRGVCVLCKKSRPDLEYRERLSQVALGEQEVCVLWTCGRPPLLPQSSRLFVLRFLASGLRAELPDRHFPRSPWKEDNLNLSPEEAAEPALAARVRTHGCSDRGGFTGEGDLTGGKCWHSGQTPDGATGRSVPSFLQQAVPKHLFCVRPSARHWGPQVDTQVLRSFDRVSGSLPSPSLCLVLVKFQSDSHAMFIPQNCFRSFLCTH